MTLGLTIAAIILIMFSMWFLGAWNSVVTLVNTILAAILASNYFEPMASAIDGGQSSYTYLLDFVCLWLLFFVSFAVLRAATDTLSRHKLQFNPVCRVDGTYGVFVCHCLGVCLLYAVHLSYSALSTRRRQFFRQDRKR